MKTNSEMLLEQMQGLQSFLERLRQSVDILKDAADNKYLEAQEVKAAMEEAERKISTGIGKVWWKLLGGERNLLTVKQEIAGTEVIIECCRTLKMVIEDLEKITQMEAGLCSVTVETLTPLRRKANDEETIDET